MPTPSTKPVLIGVRVPRDLYNKIAEMADRAGLAPPDIVRLALAKMPDDLVPAELTAAADVLHQIRRMQ